MQDVQETEVTQENVIKAIENLDWYHPYYEKDDSTMSYEEIFNNRLKQSGNNQKEVFVLIRKPNDKVEKRNGISLWINAGLIINASKSWTCCMYLNIEPTKWTLWYNGHTKSLDFTQLKISEIDTKLKEHTDSLLRMGKGTENADIQFLTYDSKEYEALLPKLIEEKLEGKKFRDSMELKIKGFQSKVGELLEEKGINSEKILEKLSISRLNESIDSITFLKKNIFDTLNRMVTNKETLEAIHAEFNRVFEYKDEIKDNKVASPLAKFMGQILAPIETPSSTVSSEPSTESYVSGPKI